VKFHLLKTAMHTDTNKIGKYRYKILALLFFATTINYFDRSIIGVMAPTLEKLFNWTNNVIPYDKGNKSENLFFLM